MSALIAFLLYVAGVCLVVGAYHCRVSWPEWVFLVALGVLLALFALIPLSGGAA